MRILSKRQLKELVLYSPQHVARLEKAGAFPKRVNLGLNRVGWVEEEVLNWLQERLDRRESAYARVSDSDQTEALQLDALAAANCDEVFVDHGMSGANRSRPALDRILASLRPNDTLVVWKLDRLGRSTIHLLEILGEPHQFAAITVQAEDGEAKPLGAAASQRLWDHLKSAGMIDAKGRVQDSLRAALKADSLELPAEFTPCSGEIDALLKKLSGRLDIKNADDRKVIKTREAILQSLEFKALWDRIKHKTTYRVEFDNAKLIDDCAENIRNSDPITKTRARFRKAGLEIGKGGVAAREDGTNSAFTTINEGDIELPDIITELQDKTQLTRASIVDILLKSSRIEDFKRNPQQFIDQAAEAIIRTKRLALVDGIKYQRIGDDDFYCQELFENEELKSYLKNAVPAKKSVFEYVVYDSDGTEKSFAEDLEANDAVKVYAKLPQWFKIPTPLGSYNPDWAILIEQDGEEKLYFVVETKSSSWWDDWRHQEGAKIKCGEKHFSAIAADPRPAKYIKATSVDGLMKHV